MLCQAVPPGFFFSPMFSSSLTSFHILGDFLIFLFQVYGFFKTSVCTSEHAFASSAHVFLSRWLTQHLPHPPWTWSRILPGCQLSSAPRLILPEHLSPSFPCWRLSYFPLLPHYSFPVEAAGLLCAGAAVAEPLQSQPQDLMPQLLPGASRLPLPLTALKPWTLPGGDPQPPPLVPSSSWCVSVCILRGMGSSTGTSSVTTSIRVCGSP